MKSRLDELTKSAAVSLSRRGFMKRLPLIGAAVGLGMVATTKPASACTPPYTVFCHATTSSCGACSPCTDCAGKRRREYHKTCRVCNGGVEICSDCVNDRTVCLSC